MLLCALGCALGAAAPAVLAPGALAAEPQAGATELGAAAASQTLALVLPLKANEAGLQRLALAVTTAGSPQYGQYEPLSVLEQRFGAPASTRARVIRYLRHVRATGVKVDATGLFADARMSVALAQRLFGTRLARFRAAHNTRFVAPTATASVPAALRGLVTGVVGLDTRPLADSTKPLIDARWSRGTAHAAQVPRQTSGYVPRTGTATGCPAALAQRGFTPNQYLTAYDYGPLRLAGLSGQGERVALIEIDGFHYSDVRSFASCFGLAVPAINVFGVGLSKPLAPGGETTLDLEVLDAVAPRLKAIDVYESNSAAADLLASLAAPLQNQGSKPQVISASLGVCEPGLAFALSRSGIQVAEGSLQLAAASGITILAASGDAGSSACIGNSGPVDALAVSYPASSWWATGVGGTNVELNSLNQIVGQPVWNDEPVALGAGGGGLSSLFRRPSYQTGVVGPNRRAVPDVSMLADVAPGYDIYCTARGDCVNGQNSKPWVPVGGTSAATPLLAGGIALVDQDLRLHGRQDVGLANPLLYALDRSPAASQVVYDVTIGDNDLGPDLVGNGQPLGCCTAAVGYDDASGLGSVDLSNFARLATLLEPKIVNVGLSLPPRQRPVHHRRLLATVTCTGRCLMAAFADVTIGHAKPFEVQSNVNLLRARGHRTVALGLSTRDLGKLRSGIGHHARIVAVVHGVILDAGGNVEKQTPGKRLVIRS